MNYELLNEIKNILNNDFDIITILKTLISSYEEAKELLKEIGFDSFCTFEKMKPIFHQL